MQVFEKLPRFIASGVGSLAIILTTSCSQQAADAVPSNNAAQAMQLTGTSARSAAAAISEQPGAPATEDKQSDRLEGMAYGSARKMIVGRYNWQPFPGRCEGAGVSAETCSTYPEINYCSGVGLGYCVMYFSKPEQCLVITTTDGPPAPDGRDGTTIDDVSFLQKTCTELEAETVP